jgi:ABC-type bacteriocin/lantibiotic exporter with double-glycine peptidase domain
MFTDLFFNSIYENQPLVLNGFLKSIKVKVSLSTIDQTLSEHPDYPSFLSITDSLKKWNVDCLALQANANNLLSIPTPFITILKDGQFIVVREILDDEIKIINQYGKKELVKMNQFIEKWTETIIIAESNELSGEIDYIKN